MMHYLILSILDSKCIGTMLVIKYIAFSVQHMVHDILMTMLHVFIINSNYMLTTTTMQLKKKHDKTNINVYKRELDTKTTGFALNS